MVELMDTLSIYEQFRVVLGEEKAKVFAQTLGSMIEEAKNAATKDDVHLVRESLDANTVRLGRVEGALERLAEAQQRTEGNLQLLTTRVDALAEAQQRTEGNLERLTGRVDALAERVHELSQAQVRTEAKLERLTEVVEKLVVRSDRHEGTLLELRFRERLPSYLGRYLRRARVLQPADLLDEVEPQLESTEVDDFLRADLLAKGNVDGVPTFLIGEVSYTADAGDVERAARRASFLRKASLPAVGLVACEVARPETVAYAREQGVRIWIDGVLLDERKV